MGAELEGCARVVVLVVAGHSGRGVLEHAARARAEPIMSQREACVAMLWPGRSRYGAKTGALGFVMVLKIAENQVKMMSVQ